jgi:hypothetical protein
MTQHRAKRAGGKPARVRHSSVGVIAPCQVQSYRTRGNLITGVTQGTHETECASNSGWLKLLHILEVMASGLGRASTQIPEAIRQLAGKALLTAWRSGRRHDRIWVIDVGRTAPDDISAEILADAFESPSSLLRETAYRQAAWFDALPPSVGIGIKRQLFTLWANGELAEQGPVITAQLRRLTNAKQMLGSYRLLRSILAADLLLLALIAALVLAPQRHLLVLSAVLVVIAHLGLRVRRAGLAASAQIRQRPTP